MLGTLASLDHYLRPPLARFLSPQQFTHIYSQLRPWFLKKLEKKRPQGVLVEHPTTLARPNRPPLVYRNDVTNAAGFDKDGALLPFLYLIGAGGAVVGTTLADPHEGNHIEGGNVNPWTPLPHSHSAINSLGLPCQGVDVLVENIQEFQENFSPKHFPIEASVMGHPKHQGPQKQGGIEYCVRQLLPHVDVIQINESCPNVLHNADIQEQKTRITKVVRIRDEFYQKTLKYVYLIGKLGKIGNVAPTCSLFAGTGIDGLVLVNTQKNYDHLRKSIDPRDLDLYDFYTKKYNGGVSGEVIKQLSKWQVEATARQLAKIGSTMFIFHVGGIRTHKDIEQSRAISPRVVKREAYTGLMENFAQYGFDHSISFMTSGLPPIDPQMDYDDSLFARIAAVQDPG